VPYRFRFADGRVFAFAGMWDVWGEGKDKLVTCCLLTATPNEVVRPFHDRMPVIIPPDRYAEWLDPDTPVDRLAELLVPHPAEGMVANPANPAVNSPKNDGPECLVPAA
jgi:putative SOS response-associated peptidase YedK